MRELIADLDAMKGAPDDADKDEQAAVFKRVLDHLNRPKPYNVWDFVGSCSIPILYSLFLMLVVFGFYVENDPDLGAIAVFSCFAVVACNYFSYALGRIIARNIVSEAWQRFFQIMSSIIVVMVVSLVGLIAIAVIFDW
jgi:hypothetical protein